MESTSKNRISEVFKQLFEKTFKLWDNFWFSDIKSHPINAFRILFGIYLFAYFIRYLPYADVLFSNEGVYSPFWIPDIAPHPAIAWIIYFITLSTIILFTLGFRTSITTPFLLFLFLYHFFLNFAVKNCSYDRLIIIFLVLLSLEKINSVWSIENKFKSFFKKTQKDSPPTNTYTSAWLNKLLCLQVALFYFGAGIFKLLQPAWSNGEILEMNMASNWGTPLSFWLLNLNLPTIFYDAATLSVVWFETLFAVLLWIKPIQKYVFIVGFFFHLSVWLLLSIPEFMICPLTYVLFVDGDQMEKIGNRIVVLWKNFAQICKLKLQKVK